MDRPSDRAPEEDWRLLLKRIGVGCLSMIVGGFIGGVVGAGIGESTEPAGGYLEGIGTAADVFVGWLVGAWAGLVLVTLIAAVREWRRARRPDAAGPVRNSD